MIWLALLVSLLPWLAANSQTRLKRLADKPPNAAVSGPAVPLPVIMELLVAALHTGVSIPKALRTVGTAVAGPLGQALKRAGRQLELGAPWAQAWRDCPARLTPVADALRLAWEAGAAPTASLRSAEETTRRRELEASRLAAARLGVRLVLPLGLCLLPAFVLIGLVPVLLSLGFGLLGT